MENLTYIFKKSIKTEIDFLVVKENKPWIMIECKNSSKEEINSSFYSFQKQINAEYMFQVVNDLDYIEYNCFELKDANKKVYKIPAKTFLSQLM